MVEDRSISCARHCVACYQNKEIVEVSSAGVVVHRLKVDFEPMCARRIANGHTIVGGRSVIEYDVTGRRVWAIRGSAGTVRHY